MVFSFLLGSTLEPNAPNASKCQFQAITMLMAWIFQYLWFEPGAQPKFFAKNLELYGETPQIMMNTSKIQFIKACENSSLGYLMVKNVPAGNKAD